MPDTPGFSAHIKMFLVGAVLTALGLFAFTQLQGDTATASASSVVQVYKTPTCGCCVKWVDYLRAEGFTVETTDVQDLNTIKARFGVPGAMSSCHTAVVGGYVVEGHVPAEDIRRLLAEEPDVAGIAVPGMPIGSPGMEQGDRRDPYATYTFGPRQEPTVFARHNQ